jgi:nucleotide-binding universal stress UspA family protein
MLDRQVPRPRTDLRAAVVVGVDDSPSAIGALAFARGLCRRTGARCYPVHVVEPGRDAAAAEARVRAAIQAARPPLGAGDLEVRIGHPAEALLIFAELHRAGLVILGGKAHSLVGRWVTGSTAVAVARLSSLPVLVTRGGVGIVSRVLVGADATPAAQGAISAGEEWATAWQAALRVLHVVPVPALVPEQGMAFDLDMVRRSGELEAAEVVWPMIGREGTERGVEVGSPGQALSELSRSWRADLLVVARHDRGWLPRAVLGSVTERLLDELPTSMLVVPATPVAEPAGQGAVGTIKEVAR